MTTIAYRDGILASDSRFCRGDVIDDDEGKKLYRLADGSICGGAGRSGSIRKLVALLGAAAKRAVKHKKRCELPQFGMKCQLLLVTPSHNLWLYENGDWEEIDKEAYAIGSGAAFAKVALDMGSTAKVAVNMAKGKDIFTGGKTRSIEV